MPILVDLGVWRRPRRKGFCNFKCRGTLSFTFVTTDFPLPANGYFWFTKSQEGRNRWTHTHQWLPVSVALFVMTHFLPLGLSIVTFSFCLPFLFCLLSSMSPPSPSPYHPQPCARFHSFMRRIISIHSINVALCIILIRSCARLSLFANILPSTSFVRFDEHGGTRQRRLETHKGVIHQHLSLQGSQAHNCHCSGADRPRGPTTSQRPHSPMASISPRLPRAPSPTPVRLVANSGCRLPCSTRKSASSTSAAGMR